MHTITDDQMNDFTHAVADALAELLGWSPDTIDRNALNQQLEEAVLRPYYDIRVVEDE